MVAAWRHEHDNERRISLVRAEVHVKLTEEVSRFANFETLKYDSTHGLRFEAIYFSSLWDWCTGFSDSRHVPVWSGIHGNLHVPTIRSPINRGFRSPHLKSQFFGQVAEP